MGRLTQMFLRSAKLKLNKIILRALPLGHVAHGVTAMSTKYQGKDVTVLRDAKQGDKGFDQNKDQVWVRNLDGTENVAPRNEVK